MYIHRIAVAPISHTLRNIQKKNQQYMVWHHWTVIKYYFIHWHLQKAVQFRDFFLQLHAPAQARLQPHLIISWQAALTLGMVVHTGRSLMLSCSFSSMVDRIWSFDFRLLSQTPDACLIHCSSTVLEKCILCRRHQFGILIPLTKYFFPLFVDGAWPTSIYSHK